LIFVFFVLIHRTYSPLYFVIDGHEGTRGSAAMQHTQPKKPKDGHEPMAMRARSSCLSVVLAPSEAAVNPVAKEAWASSAKLEHLERGVKTWAPL
jgi:hypothetical protein